MFFFFFPCFFGKSVTLKKWRNAYVAWTLKKIAYVSLQREDGWPCHFKERLTANWRRLPPLGKWRANVSEYRLSRKSTWRSTPSESRVLRGRNTSLGNWRRLRTFRSQGKWRLNVLEFTYCCSNQNWLCTCGYLLRELIYKVINSCFKWNFSTNIYF